MAYFKNKLKTAKQILHNQFKKFRFNQLRKRSFVEFQEDWFKGKRVALIGGADSAYLDKMGAYIDGCDVVIRINNGVGMIDQYHEFIGTKTDFLFHCLYANPKKDRNPITVDLWRSKNVGLLVSCHNDLISGYGRSNVARFLNITKGKYPYSSTGEKYHKKNIEAIAPNSPTTGFIVINTVMACAPKELYVTGMTFFRTSYFHDYRDEPLSFYTESFKNDGTHVPEREYQLVRELYKKHKNIIVPDKTLAAYFAEDEMRESAR